MMTKTSTTNSWTYILIGGVGIGNGWMNGLVQGPAVIDYSLVVRIDR